MSRRGTITLRRRLAQEIRRELAAYAYWTSPARYLWLVNHEGGGPDVIDVREAQAHEQRITRLMRVRELVAQLYALEDREAADADASAAPR